MAIQYVTGNLIRMAEAGEFDIIIHGANCFCVMGGGIARQLDRRYPEVGAADDRTIPGDRTKLGTYTQATVRSYDNPLIIFTIINAYTQYSTSQGEDVFEYNHFRSFCQKFNQNIPPNMVIGIPKIGAGLAGGNWERISSIIEEELSGHTIVVVEWDGTYI